MAGRPGLSDVSATLALVMALAVAGCGLGYVPSPTAPSRTPTTVPVTASPAATTPAQPSETPSPTASRTPEPTTQLTQAEACALRDKIMNDRDELLTRGIELTGGGCGNAAMTVSLYLSPLLPEVIAYMQERYAGPLSFEEGGRYPLRPIDPPTVDEVRLKAIAPLEAGMLRTCGRRLFPEPALHAIGNAQDQPGPEYDALREAIDAYTDVVPEVRSLDWVLAEADTYGATFLAQRGEGWIEEQVFASTSEWVPGVMDQCTPTALDLSGGGAQWWLNPDFPAPRAGATELHVFVHESRCAGGRSPEGWILPPFVSYAAATLTMSIGIRSPGGLSACPSNPRFPITVVLPEPLGERHLLGATEPNS